MSSVFGFISLEGSTWSFTSCHLGGQYLSRAGWGRAAHPWLWQATDPPWMWGLDGTALPLSILPLGRAPGFDHFFFSGGASSRLMSPVLQPTLYGQGAPTGQPQQRRLKRFCSQITAGDPVTRPSRKTWQLWLAEAPVYRRQREVACVAPHPAVWVPARPVWLPGHVLLLLGVLPGKRKTSLEQELALPPVGSAAACRTTAHARSVGFNVRLHSGPSWAGSKGSRERRVGWAVPERPGWVGVGPQGRTARPASPLPRKEACGRVAVWPLSPCWQRHGLWRQRFRMSRAPPTLS